MAARSLRSAVLGAALVCLLGCGDDGTDPGHREARTTRPAPQVPLSSTDPAHVVGASSFNRFHLRTLNDGDKPFLRSDLWTQVDARLAAGDAKDARAIADASEEVDRPALVAYAGKAPPVDPAQRTALRQAAEALAGGELEKARSVVEAAAPPARSLIAVQMAEIAGRAAAGLGLARSADQHFRAAALAAREIGWVRAEIRALQQAFAAQARTGERVAMLDTLKRVLVLQKAQGDLLGPARTHVDLGCVYAMLANYTRALDFLDRGAQAHRDLGHRREEAHAHAGMGLVYLRRAEYGAALDVLDRAQRLLKDTKSARSRAYVLNTLGNVYEHMGDPDRAQALYEAALELHAGQRNVDAGDVLGNLGSVHFHLERYDEAAESYAAAHAIFEEQEDRVGIANALFSVGRVKKIQGGYRTALDIYAKALALQDEGSADAARTRCAIAETHIATGNTEAAFRELDQAMETIGDGSARMVRVELLVVQALAHLRAQQPKRAVERIRSALDVMLEVTAGLADEHVVGIRERRSWIFDTGLAVAVEIGRADLAAEFIEHGRAGALLEGLGGRGARRGLPPYLVEAEARAAYALAAANRRYQQARATRKLKAMREADTAVKAARGAYRTVQQRIQREAKRLASVFHPVPDTLAALQRQLRRHDVLVLYAALPRQTYAIVITRKDARKVWLGNTEAIRKACEELAMDAGDQDRGAIAAAHGRAAALRTQLIDALELPAGTKRLLLSPDGALCYLPYPLLLAEAPFEVACLPSGTTLRLLADERGRAGSHVLALGDPNYTLVHKGHSLQVYAEGVPLEPLPATRKEVVSITGEGDTRLLGDEATIAMLNVAARRRGRWNVIHLACHGLIDPRTPTLSALALTPAETSDGFLTALEVYGMHLPADLVVLSGCNTGHGRYMKGEGLVGLMRAFMCAGAPRIVVSLWKVDDEATQALMTAFHRNWRKGSVSTAAALRAAQAEVRKTEAWSHPRYWGAWVLWGLPD